MKAYCEYKESENVFVRTFVSNVDEQELKWHWDEEDRTVEAIGKTDWEFQFDNELPISLNQPIFIPKGKIHRVIKGTKDLQVKIVKHYDK